MIIRILLGLGATIAVLVGIVLLATIFGGIDLIDFNTGVAVSLSVLVLGIIYWTLRPQINRYVNQKTDNHEVGEKESQQVSVSPILKPTLKYGRVIVRTGSHYMHGGVYDSRTYYIEVINTTPNTVAKNCTGSISIIGRPEIITAWEKGASEIIDIGHKEFLRLFRISVFSKESQLPETRLYFYSREGRDIVNEAAERRYTDHLDRRITILIKSENAHFPSRSDSFSKTIRQIINDAAEERE